MLILRDEATPALQCVFYAIDRLLPPLEKGQLVRLENDTVLEGATGQVRKWNPIRNRLTPIVLHSVVLCHTCKIRPFSFYNRTRPSVGKSTECIYFEVFIFLRFNCIATTLLFCTFPTTTETGFITQSEFFYSRLISVFVLYYQSKCFHVIKICKFFLFAMVLLRGCKQTLISRLQIPLI